MTRVLTLTLLALAVALAGCSTTDSPGGGSLGGGDSPPRDITTAQAQALLGRVVTEMPDRYGLDMAISKGGQEMMRMKGAVDNASGRSYFDVTMDPSLLEDEEGNAEAAAAFANGFSFYVTRDGVVYFVNETAFTFGKQGSFVPSPDESPFGEFMQPTEAFGELDENVTVHSVRPITHKGQAAYQIEATMQDEDHPTNATIVVYASPTRLARITADLPADSPEEGEEEDPLAGGTAVADILYDDEVELEIPEKAVRASALRYDGGGFSFDDSGGPKTWTFQADPAVVPLGEVEAQVKASSETEGETSDSSPDALAKAETLWSMTLSEGTKTEGGVTLTFTDADGDGKVGSGDTLTIEGADENGMPPQVILFDTKTGVHVVPGASLVLAAVALLGAALLLRRK